MPGSPPSPQTPVWPGTSGAAPRGARPRLPSAGAGPAAAVRLPAGRAAVAAPSGRVVRSWSVDAAAFARPGRRREERAQRQVERDEQPGDPDGQEDDERAGRRERRLEQVREEPADPAPAASSTSTWNAPRNPAYAIAMPSSVRPHGAPGSLPGPHSRYHPPAGARPAAAQRPVPKYGTEMLRQPVGEGALAGQEERDRVTAPSTSSDDPDERADDRRRQPEQAGHRQPATGLRAASAARRVPVARGAARTCDAVGPRSDLDHDREDHRPALRLLVQEARQAVLDLDLQQADLAGVVARRVERGQDPLDRGRDDRIVRSRR